MRVDSWRYLLLKEQGGLYVDLDFECLSPLDEWIGAIDKFACADQGDGRLCNAFMWCPSEGSDFLADIEDALVLSAYHPDPLKATGPHFLNDYARTRRHLMHEIPTELIYPVPFWKKNQLKRMRDYGREGLLGDFPRAKAFTYWTGSWVHEDFTLPDNVRILSNHDNGSGETLQVAVIEVPGRDRFTATQKRYVFPEADGVATYFCFDGEGGTDPANSGRETTVSVAENESPLQHICRALSSRDPDWIFVCSQFTYVLLDRLPFIRERGADLISNESFAVEGLPRVDAGFLISRRLAESIAASEQRVELADLAGLIKDNGFKNVLSPLLRHDRFRVPKPENEIVSAATSDARYFQLFDSVMTSECVLTARCAQENWQGEIHFYESGICCRTGMASGGEWAQLPSGNIFIKWFEEGAQVLFFHGLYSGVLVSSSRADYILEGEISKMIP